MLDLSAAKRDAETLLRTICQDLSGLAVYLLTAEIAPKLFSRIPPGWIGMTTGPSMVIGLQPILERSGEWTGPGFAAFLDAESIGSAAEFTAVAMHELGHYFALADNMPSDPAAVFLGVMAALTREPTATPARPWMQHELPFCRVCSHLRHRCWRAGFPAEAAALQFAGREYGLSDRMWYAAACAREVREYVHEPLAAILASPAPAELQRLWQQDTGADPGE